MPQHQITLESPWKRIHLVPPSARDDEAYAACRTHPITRRYLAFLPKSMTVEEVRIRRETRAGYSRLKDFVIYYLGDDGSTQFAGYSGYFNINESMQSCEGGIIVAPDLHGKNIATETFTSC